MDVDSELYRIRVVEENGDKVKVHYIGYSKKYDEWKNKDELVSLEKDNSDITPQPSTWQPYSLYRELANKIKANLHSSRKESPAVKIDMPFDRLLFEGGLARLGIEKRVHRGTTKLTIKTYKDLDPLLEKDWHWRGLNEAGDFCYVLLHTVEFYIYHKRSLKEFFPSMTTIERDLGYGLIFSFVRGDGVPSQFGTDHNIFDVLI